MLFMRSSDTTPCWCESAHVVPPRPTSLDQRQPRSGRAQEALLARTHGWVYNCMGAAERFHQTPRGAGSLRQRRHVVTSSAGSSKKEYKQQAKRGEWRYLVRWEVAVVVCAEDAFRDTLQRRQHGRDVAVEEALVRLNRGGELDETVGVMDDKYDRKRNGKSRTRSGVGNAG